MGVHFYTLKGEKPMQYISERIVNISDLEKLLTDIHMLSQIARNSSGDETQKLLREIEKLANQAAHFQFRLESRVTNIRKE